MQHIYQPFQVISTALGYVLPNIISPTATHHLATVLYTIFGVRLLWIGWKAEPHDNKVRWLQKSLDVENNFGLGPQEEMEEVQQKVLEAQQQPSRVARIIATICTPVFYEALVLTFLAGALIWEQQRWKAAAMCNKNNTNITTSVLLMTNHTTQSGEIGAKLQPSLWPPTSTPMA